MRKLFIISVIILSASLLMAATVSIDLWFHSGRGAEREVLRSQVESFNEMQDLVHVNAVQLPEGSYNQQVQSAAMADDLPDLLDLDGPFMTNYAWSGFLRPLDKYISNHLKNDLLPSIVNQGTYDGDIYALGTFDSGLALYANKAMLEKVGARIPKTVEDAWTREEFMNILKELKALPELEYPLDFMLSMTGEWYAYAFSPILWAFGGDLIDRSDFMSADGVLNGEEAVKGMEWVQTVVEEGYVNTNPTNQAALLEGKAAIAWNGHWYYNRAKEALGDDMVILPMPKLGSEDSKYGGQATGMGSWCWGITTKSEHPYAAWLFLQYILRPEEILHMSNANGAIPSRKSATEISELYGEGGPLQIFVKQAEKIAVERPVTPAYPVISSAFTKAVKDIIDGENVKDALNEAVQKIDQDIEDNQGYPMD